jgi:hypothetical protein
VSGPAGLIVSLLAGPAAVVAGTADLGN